MAAGIAVDLDGDGFGGFDADATDAAVVDAWAREVDASEDEPEVAEGLEGTGVSEDDEVEEPVGGGGGGGDGESEGVVGEVEEEDHGAGQGIGLGRVVDVDGEGGEAVEEAGAEDGFDVGDAGGGADLAVGAETCQVMSGDDIGVEADAGHEGEAMVGDPAEVESGVAAGGDGVGDLFGLGPDAEVAGEEVLGSGREDGEGDAGIFVDEGGEGAVAADGDEASAEGVGVGPLDEGVAFVGSPGASGGQAEGVEGVDEALDAAFPEAYAGLAVCGDSDPGFLGFWPGGGRVGVG